VYITVKIQFLEKEEQCFFYNEAVVFFDKMTGGTQNAKD
jgi:hypothetical protein